MSDLIATKRLVLDLSRAYQVQLHPTALNALVTFARSTTNSSNGGSGNGNASAAADKEAALHSVFACLNEVVSGGGSSAADGGAASGPAVGGAGSRHVNADSVSAAVARYYTIAGVKAPPSAAGGTAAGAATTVKQQPGTTTMPSSNKQQLTSATQQQAQQQQQSVNITARLQVVPPTQTPFGLVDPHSGGISIQPSANAAAQQNGTFTRADRQFALTQRYWAALGRCHRSGLYRKGISNVGVGAVADDRRPALVPISSLEGLPDHIETALLGILQFASLADGSGSGTATDNLSGGLDSTAVGWRLEDPRATIPLLFPPNFNSDLCVVRNTNSNNGADDDGTAIIAADGTAIGQSSSDKNSAGGSGGGSSRVQRRVGFLLKGACVVAMGKWTPDGYLVKRLELPPGETREVTLGAQNGVDTFGLAPHDPIRARATEQSAVDDVIIFISRVHLDKTSVLFNLSKLFGALKERTDDELKAMTFVLVGDFSSKPVASGDISHFSESATSATGGSTGTNTNANNASANHGAVNDPTASFINGREGFAALFDQLGATISAAASNVAQHARFVLVPGPRDLSLLRGVVPQPPIPMGAVLNGLMKKVPHVTAASNPCRLRFLTKEIIVAQSDFYQSLRAESFHLNTTPKQQQLGNTNAAAFPTSLHSSAAAAQNLRKLNAIHVDDDDDNDNAASLLAKKEQPFEHVVKTIIDYAHLFPAVPSSAAAVLSTNMHSLSGTANSAANTNPMVAAAKTSTSSSSLAMQRTIVWPQDHLLKLSPLPQFLLLCDQTVEWSCTYRGCKVLNPGCFSSTTSFVWFTPADGEITFNTI